MKALSLVRKVKTLREVRYGGGGQSFSMSVLTKMSQTRSEFRSSHQINVKQWPDFSQFVHCSEKRCEDTLSFLSSMNKLLSKEYFVQPLFFSFSLTSNDVIVLQWSRLLFLRDKISSWKSLSFFSP